MYGGVERATIKQHIICLKNTFDTELRHKSYLLKLSQKANRKSKGENSYEQKSERTGVRNKRSQKEHKSKTL